MRTVVNICVSLCIFLITVNTPLAVATGAPQGTAKAEGIRIVDDTGHELVLKEPVTRILALYGALSELLLELNMGHSLVGRTAADANIEGLKHLRAVGTHMRPNAEIILSLKPQVVLQFLGRTEAESFGLGLRRHGVNVLFFRLQTFEDMFRVIKKLGQLTGKEQEAEVLVTSYQKRLGHVRSVVQYERRVPVFYEVRYPNLLGAGRQSMAHDIILMSGGHNVIVTDERIVRINEEELLRLNPEAYIVQVGPMNPAPLPMEERPHFGLLSAVKNNRILEVRELAFARPGPKAVDTVEMLARWLHPKVNFDVTLNEEKDATLERPDLLR